MKIHTITLLLIVGAAACSNAAGPIKILNNNFQADGISPRGADGMGGGLEVFEGSEEGGLLDTWTPEEDLILPEKDLPEAQDLVAEDLQDIPSPEDTLIPEDTMPDIIPSLCCNIDSSCPPDMVCTTTEDGSGICTPVPSPGECYSYADCTKSEVCAGAQLPPCGLGEAPTAGHCESVYPCCTEDDQCPNGQECVLEDSPFGGTCHNLPMPFGVACWDDGDCLDGFTCKNAYVCGCGDGCMFMETPGTCQPLNPPDNCCVTDSDCSDWMICIAHDQNGFGVCDVPPEQGRCWDQDDCSLSEYCANPNPCPCGFDCLLSEPGFCQPLYSECCFSDQMCQDFGPGYTCGGETGTNPGRCMLEPGISQCWDDGDCAGGMACFGAAFCPCGADCDMEEHPGLCIAADCWAVNPRSSNPWHACSNNSNCVGENNICTTWELSSDLGFCTRSCSSTQECGPGAYCLFSDTVSGRCVPEYCLLSGSDGDECQTDSDCILGRDYRNCCQCLEAFSRQEVAVEPCILSTDDMLDPYVPSHCIPGYCAAAGACACEPADTALCADGQCVSVWIE